MLVVTRSAWVWCVGGYKIGVYRCGSSALVVVRLVWIGMVVLAVGMGGVGFAC